MNIFHSGEILSLASGLAWAIGVILFLISGRKVHPIGLNIFKNLVAFILIFLTLLITGKSLLAGQQPKILGIFLLSGVLGIAVSDTLFFISLNRLGASIMAIIECFYSPFIIILSYFFLAERLTAWQIIGALLVASAVLTTGKAAGSGGNNVSKKDLAIGIPAGIMSMFFVAIGIVLIKPYLNSVSVIWATWIRLVGGIVALALFLTFYPRRFKILKPLVSLENWKPMMPAAFFGTYLSLILWVGGMKYTEASVAAVLNQLNAVFIVILAVLFLKEKLTRWKVIAVILAVSGAILISIPI